MKEMKNVNTNTESNPLIDPYFSIIENKFALNKSRVLFSLNKEKLNIRLPF